MKGFEIIIADTPDREILVVETWQKDQMTAGLNQENESLEVQIYFSKDTLSPDFEEYLVVNEWL